MDMLDILQEAYEETTAAATDYGVNEAEVAVIEHQAARMIPCRDEWALTGMQRVLLDVAAQHHQDCASPGCRTCASIRYGLGVTLAQLRVLVGVEERVLSRRSRSTSWAV